MGVLYMALLEAPTYECWIPFKTMHFSCALGLLERHRPQVYVSWQTNLLFTYVVKVFYAILSEVILYLTESRLQCNL